MKLQNIRRSLRRLRRTHAEDVIRHVQQWLRAGADPATIKAVTGLPLRTISRIKSDHEDVGTDVADWLDKRER